MEKTEEIENFVKEMKARKMKNLKKINEKFQNMDVSYT